MSTYIKGVRVWHVQDTTQQGKTFMIHGRKTLLVACGGFAPITFAQASTPSDSDPVCAICLKAPSDAAKRSINRTYAANIPVPTKAASNAAGVAAPAPAQVAAKKAAASKRA